MTARDVRRFLRRVQWLPVCVFALCVAAIIWIVVNPAAYLSCLVLVGAAIPLAILGRDST